MRPFIGLSIDRSPTSKPGLRLVSWRPLYGRRFAVECQRGASAIGGSTTPRLLRRRCRRNIGPCFSPVRNQSTADLLLLLMLTEEPRASSRLRAAASVGPSLGCSLTADRGRRPLRATAGGCLGQCEGGHLAAPKKTKMSWAFSEVMFAHTDFRVPPLPVGIVLLLALTARQSRVFARRPGRLAQIELAPQSLRTTLSDENANFEYICGRRGSLPLRVVEDEELSAFGNAPERLSLRLEVEAQRLLHARLEGDIDNCPGRRAVLVSASEPSGRVGRHSPRKDIGERLIWNYSCESEPAQVFWRPGRPTWNHDPVNGDRGCKSGVHGFLIEAVLAHVRPRCEK